MAHIQWVCNVRMYVKVCDGLADSEVSIINKLFGDTSLTGYGLKSDLWNLHIWSRSTRQDRETHTWIVRKSLELRQQMQTAYFIFTFEPYYSARVLHLFHKFIYTFADLLLNSWWLCAIAEHTWICECNTYGTWMLDVDQKQNKTKPLQCWSNVLCAYTNIIWLIKLQFLFLS